jgi:hypothetical protein
LHRLDRDRPLLLSDKNGATTDEVCDLPGGIAEPTAVEIVGLVVAGLGESRGDCEEPIEL